MILTSQRSGRPSLSKESKPKIQQKAPKQLTLLFRCHEKFKVEKVIISILPTENKNTQQYIHGIHQWVLSGVDCLQHCIPNHHLLHEVDLQKVLTPQDRWDSRGGAGFFLIFPSDTLPPPAHSASSSKGRRRPWMGCLCFPSSRPYLGAHLGFLHAA